MPLSPVQQALLAWLDRHADENRYVSGGAVLALDGPRLSEDLDLFMLNRDAIAKRARDDLADMTAAGFQVVSEDVGDGRAVAYLRWQGSTTKVEWCVDNARRFFPLVRDPDFGWRLALFDLAVNKVRAAATRSEPRDVVDLVLLDRDYMPLGQLVWAAAGKSTMAPQGLLDAIVANAAHSRSDYDGKVKMQAGVSASELAEDFPNVVAEARLWIEEVSALADPDLYGVAFTDTDGRPAPCDASDIQAGLVSVRESTDNPSAPLDANAEVPWGEVYRPGIARARRMVAIRRVNEALMALQVKVKATSNPLAAYFAAEDDHVGRDVLRAELALFRERIKKGEQGPELLADIRAAISSAFVSEPGTIADVPTPLPPTDRVRRRDAELGRAEAQGSEPRLPNR